MPNELSKEEQKMLIYIKKRKKEIAKKVENYDQHEGIIDGCSHCEAKAENPNNQYYFEKI